MTTDTAPDTVTEFETVIGLEVHCQLRTQSKMFCRCPADYASAEPNTYVCPLCLGMPGTLPVINKTAVEWTIRTALALNMTIPELSKFDRKNYPYPDLMKGYQISQYDMPLSEGGWMDVETEDLGKRRIGITRVHLEEDTARLLHRENEAGERFSLVDVNRSGVPLMEIVSEPDMRSPDEARTYLVQLRQILRYLGVSTADMEKGSFRCDANVSLRPMGSIELGAKVEIKNMNSFRGVHSALEHEVKRQAEVLRGGGKIDQETRGWDEDRQVTLSQRSKEEAHDYRYFPEPDLPPLSITSDEVEAIRSQLPELPEERCARFQSEYGLGEFEANLLTEEPSRADYFDQTVSALEDASHAKEAANWITGDLFAQVNKDPSHPDLEDQPIRPGHIAELVGLIVGGDISRSQARTVFESMYETGDEPGKIVKDQGLTQISGEDALSPIISQVIGDNPDAVNDYRSGKEAALKYLVGQVMRHSRGQANPAQASELLVSALSPLDPSHQFALDKFIAKWLDATNISESSYPEHFADLCAALGIASAVDPVPHSYRHEPLSSHRHTHFRPDIWKKGCFLWEYNAPGHISSSVVDHLQSYAAVLPEPLALVACDFHSFRVLVPSASAQHTAISFTIEQLRDESGRYLNLLRGLFNHVADAESIASRLPAASSTEHGASAPSLE